jgi:hypothetical protein
MISLALVIIRQKQPNANLGRRIWKMEFFVLDVDKDAAGTR